MVNSILPLVIEDAVVRKGSKTILGPVSIKLAANGFTIVMGPNGAGKTSFLRLIHGLERPKQGGLSWQAGTAAVRTRQSLVFQTPIVMRRTVIENLIYPLVVRGTAKAPASKLAERWLDRIGLAGAVHQQAVFLSGGDKQKLAIARALIIEPELLLLDEPTTNLDGRATREIEELLKEAHNSGTRIVMSTHSIGQAQRLAADIIFLYRGNIHETAPADRFFDSASTKEAAVFVKGGILE